MNTRFLSTRRFRHWSIVGTVGTVGLVLEIAAFASCATNGDLTEAPDASPNVIGEASTTDASDEPEGLDDAGPVEWEVVTTPHDSKFAIAAVWGSSKNDVWMVGARGSVLHYDGSTWLSTKLDTDSSLFSVGGTGPNDVWIAGMLDGVFHVTGISNGSLSSSSVPILTFPEYWWGAGLDARYYPNNPAYTVWGFSPGNVWIGGNGRWSCGGSACVWPDGTYVDTTVAPIGASGAECIWKTASAGGDGGAWSPVTNLPGGTSIHGIWASSERDVWSVGAKLDGPSAYAIHTDGVPVDGGAPAWTELDTQSTVVLNAIWGASADDVWLVGGNGTIRHFGNFGHAPRFGDQWEIVDSPTTVALNAIWGSGPADVWAVGEHGTILHYDGTGWRSSRSGLSAGSVLNLHGIWGSGPDDVWIVGDGVVLHHSGSAVTQGGSP